MKKLSISLFAALLLAVSAPVFAQVQNNGDVYGERREGGRNRVSNRRLLESAQTLLDQAENLSDDIYRDYRSRNRGRSRNVNAGYNTYADFQAVFAADQFKSGATLFAKMVTDRSPASDLRQAVSLLQQLAQNSSATTQSGDWSEIQSTLSDIVSQLDNSYNNGDSRYGTFTWRGVVDDRVQLVIQNSNVQVVTVRGKVPTSVTHNFTSPLPRRVTSLTLNKQQGRGTVTIIQQPSQSNNWTAIVEIRDTSSGAATYQLDLNW